MVQKGASEAGAATIEHLCANIDEKELKTAENPRQKNYTTSVEVSCATLKFPSDANLLQNPNVFIGDTAATCHSSFLDVGTSNLEDSNNKPTIKAGNGGLIKPEKIGDASGMVCSAEG